MKAFFVGILAGVQSLFHGITRPSIEYREISPKPEIRTVAKADESKCQVRFYVGTLNRKFHQLGEFVIPEGAYGDGSDEGYLQFDDLIARLKPVACEKGGNAVILEQSPEHKGVRKALLISLVPKGNSSDPATGS